MKKILVPFLLLAMTGCASIVNGTNQPLSVATEVNGVDITGAYCKLSNDKGTWFVTTPGSTTVHRSTEDLYVKCKKKGDKPGLADVKSSVKGMAFGNVLFGGIIGGAVDAADGAAFDYPNLIKVEMGKNITVKIKPSTPPQQKATKVSAAHTSKKSQQP